MFPLPAFAEKAKQQQMSLSAGTADNDAITAYLTIENTPLSLTALRPLKRLYQEDHAQKYFRRFLTPVEF